MLQGDRQLDYDFEPEELLFMRLRSDHIDGKQVIVSNFPIFPNPSSNREKYSEPGDVLLPIYLDWGIIKLRVVDVSKRVAKGDGIEVEMQPVHVPEVMNYSHTEISAFDPSTGEKLAGFQNKPAIKFFKGEIAKRAVVVKVPAITKEEWEAVKSARLEFQSSLEASHVQPKSGS